MNKYDINQALISHLLLMPSLPAIAYENGLPLTDDLFITIHDLSVDDTYYDFCNTQDTTGILQVDVYGTRDTGSKQVMQLADKIANHFRFKSISEVMITKAVVESSIMTERHYRKPISIYYRNIS